MIIICDKCKGQVSAVQSSKPHEADFIDVGFECPHCGAFYHSYYDHPKLQVRRKRLRDLSGKEELDARNRYATYYQKMQGLAGGLT
jgi:transcription initiation factor IIE alpha subunit